MRDQDTDIPSGVDRRAAQVAFAQACHAKTGRGDRQAVERHWVHSANQEIQLLRDPEAGARAKAAMFRALDSYLAAEETRARSREPRPRKG